MNYQLNDFGKASFKIKKRGQTITGFNGYGRIIDIDAKCVLFKDNEDYEFIVKRSDFTFEVEEFKTKQNDI